MISLCCLNADLSDLVGNLHAYNVCKTLFFLCLCHRNMLLAERCCLLSAEILKSQTKYSDAATLLIKMTSEVSSSPS